MELSNEIHECDLKLSKLKKYPSKMDAAPNKRDIRTVMKDSYMAEGLIAKKSRASYWLAFLVELEGEN